MASLLYYLEIFLHYLGLSLFILMVVLDVIGLLNDLYLLLKGFPTITSIVRNNLKLATPIIALQFLGIVGLLLHFFTSPSPVFEEFV